MNTEEDINFEKDENLRKNSEQGLSIEDDITKVFENPEYAYPLEDVLEEFKKLGYTDVGKTVLYAMQDDLLYVDNIEDDGTVYIAVVEDDEEE